MVGCKKMKMETCSGYLILTLIRYLIWSPPSASFPDFVNRLIGDSQRQLHDVFTRTYGVLYERNSALFADYFRRIRSFYSRGAGGSLQEATVKFFTELYRKMFQVLCTRMKTLRF